MALPGRKRKQGERRNGRIVRNERAQSITRRLLDSAFLRSHDAAFGTVFGRMLLEGFLQPEHFDAASRFGISRARADMALGVPPRNPRALQYEYASRGRSSLVDDEEREKRAIEHFDKAEAAIGLGSAELSAVEDVVIYDQLPANYSAKLACRDGLTRLVVHWDIRA